MESMLDPDSDFLTSNTNGFVEPIDSSILTQPAWIDVFLTPGATFNTWTPAPVTMTPTHTAVPPTPTPTAIRISLTPTSTFIYYPPPTVVTRPPASPRPPTNTPVPSADLQIIKDDGITTYTSNGTNTYTIIVTNNGPGNVIGATITDNIPAQVQNWTWVCASQTNGANGCDPVTNVNTNFSDNVNLPSAASITYTVTAAISGTASGDLINTVTVGVPTNYKDPNPGNNTATDTDTFILGTDLQITKDDFKTTYSAGSTFDYTVIVTNNGPNSVTGATITDNKPEQVETWGWCNTPSCVPVATGTGDLTDTINLASGASITYTVRVNISQYAVGTLTNAATVNTPSGITDTNPANNSDADSDTLTSSEPDIGPPDGDSTTVTPGTSLTILFSPAIVAGGNSTPDFVYYEIVARNNPYPQVDLDWVEIEISQDGNSWIPVFYWGNGVSDDNTNVSLTLPGINSVCFTNPGMVPAETDNCPIPTTQLYNSTGITVDIDAIPGIVAGASYPWMRITSPAGSQDGANVDAIQPYYP